jgi:glutamate-1-semialdehyde 2,1-aminomutase
MTEQRSMARHTLPTYTYSRSHALFERATEVIPSGIYGHFSPSRVVPSAYYPYFAAEGRGSHFTDVDGNDFIDYMCAYGPMVLGYNHPVVEEAARKQAEKGDTLMGPAEVMVDLAEYLVDLVPAASWAFFSKNGGDMTTYATMVARAATGRSRIVAIKGGYHGMAAWMQGSGQCGVVEEDVANVVRIPWNDPAAFERVLDEYPDQVAGFISTPYNHPSFEDSALPAEGYWRRIRELCDKHGVVLIIDDVRCGFRLDLRGSNEYFGFTPDLICFCKAIANGHALSALVGRADLKDEVSKVRFTGSYWFQAVPMAAALACLQELRRIDAPRLMAEYGRRLAEGMVRLAEQHGFHLKISGPPQLPYMRLVDETLMLHQRFCGECTRRGAYFASGRNWFVSTAHTEEDLQSTLQIVDDVLSTIDRSDPSRV